MTRVARAAATADDDDGKEEEKKKKKKEDQEEGVHSLLNSDLGAELPLHISLSRPIVLKANQRRGFIDSLTKKIDTSSIAP